MPRFLGRLFLILEKKQYFCRLIQILPIGSPQPIIRLFLVITMKTPFFLILFCLSWHIQETFGHPTLKYTEIDSTVYQKLLSPKMTDFHIFDINCVSMLDFLHNNPAFDWQLGENLTWKTSVTKNNFLLSNTKITSATKHGIHLPFLELYNGQINTNSYIHFSIDSTTLYATIIDEQQNTWLLQPLQDWLPNQAASSHHILYRVVDIPPIIPLDCGNKEQTTQIPTTVTNPFLAQQDNSSECIETIRLSLVCEYSMLQKHQTAARLTKYLITLLQSMNVSYTPLYVQFALQELYIIDCENCSYFSSSTNPNVRLDSFRDYINTHTILLPNYDVAQLWTNDDLDGTVIGLSYINGICTTNKYSLVEDVSPKFQAMRMLMAHELGHSLGANHDPNSTNYIMRPTISATATEFSPISVNDIKQTIVQRSCLANCTNCHTGSKPTLYNRLNNSSQITWTPSDDTNLYGIALYFYGTTTLADSLVVSDTTCTFVNLNPCKLYEARVHGICNNGNHSVAQKILIPTATVAASLQKVDDSNYQILAYNNGLNVQLLFRETGSSSFILNQTVSAFPHNLPPTSPCKNYEVILQYMCDSLVGGSTTLSIAAISSYGLVTQKQDATNIGIAFFSTATNYDFRVQITKVLDNLVVIDTILLPTSLHSIGNLKPCTNYEAAVFAACPDGTFAPKRTATFTTADIAILQIQTDSCNNSTQTYQAEVSIGHNHLADSQNNTFTVWVNNLPYVYNYEAAPQTIVLPPLPADANQIAIQIKDNHFSDECQVSTQYTAPPSQCRCNVIFFENFENCTLPNAWKNTPLGNNWQAKWQIGNTSNNKNLDGTCMAFFDDDSQDNDGGETVQLESPAINLDNYTDISLQFDYNFHTINGDFWIDIWNGSQWIRLADANGGNCGAWDCDYPHADFDVTPYKNANFKIRFIYTDGDAWDWYVGIDNIQLCGYPTNDSCTASFYYPNGTTYCSSDDFPSPVISGSPNGIFSATPSGLSIDPQTGLINLTNSVIGNYTVSYTVNNICLTTQHITIRLNCYTTLRAKVFLQGCYSPLLHQQTTTLLNTQQIPLYQPYHTTNFQYFGTEKVAIFADFPSTTVDWILLELRQTDNPTQIIATKVALLLNNGTITDADNPNSNSVKWYGIADQPYLLTIKHRNHLAIQSSIPIILPNSTPYNFTNAADKAMGIDSQATLENNIFGMYVGDSDANHRIQFADYNTYISQQSGTNTYTNADFNMDGIVNLLDYLKLKPNLKRIGFVRP